MKKYLTPILFLIVSLTVVTMALAAGGDASDPLASLSYLTGTFQSKVDSAVDQRLDTSDALLLQQTDAKLSGGSGGTPYVIQERVPEVEGVLVLADGAGSATVKAQIAEAVQALFPVEAHKIRVLKRGS